VAATIQSSGVIVRTRYKGAHKAVLHRIKRACRVVRRKVAPLVRTVSTRLEASDEPAIKDWATLDGLVGLLLHNGQCEPRAIERGRRVAEESGQRLDSVLIQLGLVTERSLAQAYSQLLGIDIATTARYPEEPLFAERLGIRFLQQARSIPVAVDGDAVVVAMADPLDRFTPAAIAAATGLPVRLEVAVPIELEAALERLYAEAPATENANTIAETAEPLEEDAERLKDLASEAPVIRLVNQIISRAVETRASDIHLEPFEDRLRVRYRYDGVLHEADSPPARLTAAIISRVKIMSRLDIAERRLPQDGRVKLAVRGTEIDFRVSTIPSLHGETVVMRVLDRSTVAFEYTKLGLPPAVISRWNKTLELPNGIVLVTGPTGSGKTTTLYTGLLALNSVARKIVTVEDPVEYQLAGINQIQVKPQIGLNFASLLRSILRQDPDVIMVGEIRDLETAQIAIQAALTGHLVLSTVHTNSAAATITRLRDMGVEDYLLTAVLRGILAQRLVRRLCTNCRQEVDAPAELIHRFDLDRRNGGQPVRIWHPAGCDQCRNTGFRGRQAIAEFLVPDAAIERLVFAGADQVQVERAAVEAGMTPMFDAGLDAALAGVTTIEEVVRSIRSDG
jgi:general secretion pathway protein E